MLRRIGVLAAVLGLLTLTGGVASATTETPEPLKSYVCKYVGEPGPGERLQTGQNPIYVSNASLGVGAFDPVAVGDTFADAQGRSVVIVANTEKLDPEPSVSECPLTPPDPEVVVDTEDRMSCEAGVEERTVTTTTPFVYDYDENEWVAGEPTVEYGDWTFVRDLTAEERAQLECDEAPQPITTTVKQEKSNCDGYFMRTITTTTLEGEVTDRVVSEWKKVGDLSKADQVELECLTPTPPPPNPTPNPPKAPELPATGAGTTGLLALLGTFLVTSGGILYRRFGL